MKKILMLLMLCAAAGMTVNASSSLRAGVSTLQGDRILLQHVYEWQDNGSSVTVSEADPFYVGGWNVTAVNGASAGTVDVNGGITPLGVTQPLKVAGNIVTLAVGDEPVATVTATATSVAGGVTTRVDSVCVYYLVNEEWWVNGAPLADVKGELLSDGSVHIADGFAYYIETTVTTTITYKNGTSNTYTDETVSLSPIYRDTWLLVANGKHEFVSVADGTMTTVDVNIRQSGDTVWVTNLYGYGAPEVYMVLNEDGTMDFASQMIRDIPADMAAGGNGLWMNSAVSGTATTTAITWGQTTPTDGVHTWNGWRNNRLYFTDGSQFVIPSDVQVIRGDVNNDGAVNISDVTALINALLSSNLAPSATFSPENADCNKDGNLSIADVTSLINYLLSQNWPN